jgi:SPP1 gp7 family putative phage head morphogenesis protein
MSVADDVRLPFNKAVSTLRDKTAISTETWNDFSGEAQNYAFTIAGLTQAEVLQDLQDLVDEAIQNGSTPEEFIDQFKYQVGDRWTVDDSRIRQILDSNVRSSERQGKYERLMNPALQSMRPYLMWRHRDSVVPRPAHLALNGKVFPANHPFWSIAFPSCAFGCKCVAMSLSGKDVARMGLTIEEPPDPHSIAGPGWGYTPGAGTDEMRTEILQKGLESLSPALKDQVQADLSQRGLI